MKNWTEEQLSLPGQHGGTRPGAGRPKLGGTKPVTRPVRLSAEHWALARRLGHGSYTAGLRVALDGYGDGFRYEDFVADIAGTVESPSAPTGLTLRVFDAVCSAPLPLLAKHLRHSDDWENSGAYHNAWTLKHAPDYPDPFDLGEWIGYDLASVQELCQDVLDRIRGDIAADELTAEAPRLGMGY